MNKIYSEKDFENHFENGLKLNGYKKLQNTSYNPSLTLHPEDLLTFIKESQLKQYKIIEKNFQEKTDKLFMTNFRSVNSRGLLDVLKNGVGFNGARFELIFEPITSLKICKFVQ